MTSQDSYVLGTGYPRNELGDGLLVRQRPSHQAAPKPGVDRAEHLDRTRVSIGE